MNALEWAQELAGVPYVWNSQGMSALDECKFVVTMRALGEGGDE